MPINQNLPRSGFHTMPMKRAKALSLRGTQTVIERANDYAYTYAPFIRGAVREVGQTYSGVARWLYSERIPAQRCGRWTAQAVKNLVQRYQRLTGRTLLVPYKTFPNPARRKDTPLEHPTVPPGDWGPGRSVRRPKRGIYWL